jgi:hypothetical protein
MGAQLGLVWGEKREEREERGERGRRRREGGVWRGIWRAALVCYGIQAAVGTVGILGQTERFYDISGSLTFLATILSSLHDVPSSLLSLAQVLSILSFLNSLFLSYSSPLSLSLSLSPQPSRVLVNSLLVVTWAARLGTFLFWRITHDGKDRRFDGVRERPSVFWIYWMVQATWVLVCLLPVIISSTVAAQSKILLTYAELRDVHPH